MSASRNAHASSSAARVPCPTVSNSVTPLSCRAMPVAVPRSLNEIASRVDARLARLLESERQRWSAVDADLVAPLDALARLVLAGGKRLRPAFCHWGYVGAGGDPEDDAVVDAGAAFEL